MNDGLREGPFFLLDLFSNTDNNDLLPQLSLTLSRNRTSRESKSSKSGTVLL